MGDMGKYISSEMQNLGFGVWLITLLMGVYALVNLSILGLIMAGCIPFAVVGYGWFCDTFPIDNDPQDPPGPLSPA